MQHHRGHTIMRTVHGGAGLAMRSVLRRLRNALSRSHSSLVRIWDGAAGVFSRSPHFPEEISSLRVGLIADTFTAQGLAPECECVMLSPGGWREQMRLQRPDLLFVESCWRGIDGEWRGQVQTASAPLRRIVSFCRRRRIPTVFWAKEDPTHWDDFLATARLFDWVFTTDSECVPRYIRSLGHERVAVLQFAIQPKLHHPIAIDSSPRVHGAMFAGAWYQNFPKRCEQFVAIADGLMRVADRKSVV